MNKGDIYYILKGDNSQPAVILGKTEQHVTVAFLSGNPHGLDAYHVEVDTGRRCYVLAETVTTIRCDKVGDYCCTLGTDEIEDVEDAIASYLHLPNFAVEKKVESVVSNPKSSRNETLIRERDTYKYLYEQLLRKVVAGE